MVKLVDTSNLTLKHRYSADDDMEFYEIPVIGDGNCAFNAFALWLIGAVKCGYHIPDEDGYTTFSVFIEHLKDEKNLQSLKDNIPYQDLTESIQSFINFINDTPKISRADFENYIFQKTSSTLSQEELRI